MGKGNDYKLRTFSEKCQKKVCTLPERLYKQEGPQALGCSPEFDCFNRLGESIFLHTG